MKYLMAFCMTCLSFHHLWGGTQESSSIDECVSVITSQDIQALKSISADALQILSGQKKLTSDQAKACRHLAQSGRSCSLPKELSNEILSQDLQVMEILAGQGKTSFSQEEVTQIRMKNLEQEGLTVEEYKAIVSIDLQNISQEDVALIQKYIELAKEAKAQIAFTIDQRLSLLRAIAQNMGTLFLQEDLAALRRAELLVNGLLEKEIDLLMDLANLKEMDLRLAKEQIEVLKKWIVLENLFSARDVLSFSDLAKLHAILQSQTNPPFSVKELKLDEAAFQNQMNASPFMDEKEIEALKRSAENISGYLSQDQGLSYFQILSLQKFMNHMFQFGRVPDLSPLEIGQLLQLVEVRVEFQSLMHVLKNVRFIELMKAKFSLEQKKTLDELVEKKVKYNQLSLDKHEIEVLKIYIVKAKNPGGLNGFGSKNRASLFAVVLYSVENKAGKFTSSDLEILRRVEQQNNGFNDKDIYQLKMIAKKLQQNKPLTVEELDLIREFTRIEKQVGLGTIVDLKESELFYDMVQKRSSQIDQESFRFNDPGQEPSLNGREEAVIYEQNQNTHKPLLKNSSAGPQRDSSRFIEESR